ncbi:MAG: site-specific integrase [Cytophagaceae bacterium]|nr:MAG: site-specific integrase [Cytophagaceae bacterium]
MARTADSPVSYLLRDPKATKPTPIVCAVRFENQRLNFGSGFKVLPTHWNSGTSRVKNVVAATDKDDINTWLIDTEKAIKAIISDMKANRIPLSKENVKARVDAYLKPVAVTSETPALTLFDFIDQFISSSPERVNIETGKHISSPTIQTYRPTVKALREFATTYRRPVDFETIDLAFYEAFTTYLTKKQGLAVNTVGKYIKTLKVFLNEAAAKAKGLGIEVNPEYRNSRFKTLKEDADNVFLTESELKLLIDLNLADNPRLDRVRDLFLVGCYTGLRFSDFTAIRPEYVHNGLIRMEQFKTQGRVVIPCHPVVTAMLDKYDGVLPHSISNQKMNDYVKELCKLAEITQRENKSITKGGKRVMRTVEKWEIVSTHTARRSFATNMYVLGVPAITIMKITGHKTEKAFMRYIKLDEEQHAQIIAQHWQKQVTNSSLTKA